MAAVCWSAAIAAPFTDADLAAANRLHDAALRGTGAYAIVASLTTEVGPRLAGSPGDAAAVAWAVAKLQSLGFENVRTQEAMVPHWERGAIEVSVVSPWPQSLAALALGGSVATPVGGVDADVISVPSLEALQTLSRDRVAGHIVFVNTKMERTRDVSGYDEAVMTRIGAASAAARQGAVGVLIRSVGTDNNRLAHTGVLIYTQGEPRIAAAALSIPDADLLQRQIDSGKPVRLHFSLAAKQLDPVKSANVIGEFRGTVRPEEIVLLGAHLDSWDPGTGAIDDGAGVAIVTEAARLIHAQGLNPKRTLRVALFANEEFGGALSGRAVYAAQAAQEKARHVLAMEADLGVGPVWRLDSNVTVDSLPAVDAFAHALGVSRGGNADDGGSDILPLIQQGVPILTLQLDATTYFDFHHTANDTLDKVDAHVLDRSVAAYSMAAFLAASMDTPFAPTKH